MDARHPYELIPLFTAGILLGLWLVCSHGLMLAKPGMVQGWLKTFPRSPLAGQILLGLAMAWCWLLVAPDGMGKLSALQMDLGEFNKLKGWFRLLIPFAYVATCVSVRDFLAVRALGLMGLLVAAPLLQAAFLKDPTTRLLIPIFAYALLTKSIFWVGKPYIFRDLVTWATVSQKRWVLLSCGGIAYGVVTLFCAIFFWRGY